MLSCQCGQETLGVTRTCILGEYKHVMIALLGLATAWLDRTGIHSNGTKARSKDA